MSFVPDYKLSELSKMAGFDTVDELAMYASTTRQNLELEQVPIKAGFS